MAGNTVYANKSAVVLDDNPQMRAILRSILTMMGMRTVAEFGEPLAVLHHLQAQPADVAVLDLVLNSEMDGFELAKQIRYDPQIFNPTMPIITVTGYANITVIEQAINHGVDELIMKPFSARDLMARVEKVIKRPRSYIRTPSGYFGPDRRRRIDPDYVGPERRAFDVSDSVDSTLEARRAIAGLRPDPIIEQRSIDEAVFEVD